MDVVSYIGLGVALFACAIALTTHRTAQRSLPDQLRQYVAALRGEVDTLTAQVASQESKIVGWRSEVEAVLEAVELVLDQVEHKRRSTAAKLSKIEAKDAAEAASGAAAVTPADPSTMNHHELERFAKSRGMLRS